MLLIQLLTVGRDLMGQQQENVQLRRRVDDVVKRFDANTLSERSRAERELLEIGADALPFLPSSDLVESVSSRETLRRLRIELERRAARDSSEPSRVTLRGELTVAAITKEIERQTRNRLVMLNATETDSSAIALDWDRVPFWTAIDELCHRGNVSWRFSKDQSAIQVVQSPAERAKELKIQTAGAFRIAIEGIEIRPIFGDDSQRLVRINGRVAVEPRIRPLFLSMAAKSLIAVDENQRPLLPWNEEAKYEIPAGDGAHEVGIQWDFRLPTGRTLSRVSLRGEMRCEIAAARERVVFDSKSLIKGAIKRRGGVTIRIRQVDIDHGAGRPIDAEVGVTVSYETGGPAFESHRAWMFYNAAYFEMPSGERIDFLDNDTAQQADGAVAIDYRWKEISLPKDGFHFVYEAPTLIMNVPIHVDIVDLRVEGPAK